jgi:hypothetical protein
MASERVVTPSLNLLSSSSADWCLDKDLNRAECRTRIQRGSRERVVAIHCADVLKVAR